MILNENLFEEDCLNEYLQYDNRRDEDAIEDLFDDTELLADEEQAKIDKEAMDDINRHEAEFGADGWRAFGSGRGLGESAVEVKEDMTLPAVSDEEILKTEESPSELVEDNAYSNSLIDALNDEWATVQKYQDIVNQLTEHEEFKKFIPVIEDIIKDEKNHVGNLQKVLDEINPKTLPDIKDGEEEATEQMGEENKEGESNESN